MNTVTSVQTYVFVCLINVVAVIFQYALIIYKTSPLETLRRKVWTKVTGRVASAMPAELEPLRRNFLVRAVNWVFEKFDSKFIDVGAMIVIPLSFIIFNIVYWFF